MRFKQIEFGNASAEVESANSPRLLIDGYLDSSNVTTIACEGNPCLFLGYKGSGKTALAQRLKLLADTEPELFVRNLYLADLPYPLFLKIVGADDETGHSIAWSWVLLTALLDSFEEDQGVPRDSEYSRAIAALRKANVLPVADLPSLVGKSANRSMKVSLPLDFGIEVESAGRESDDLWFLHVVEYLRRIAKRFRSSSRHLIVIDGLDDVLARNVFQYHSLMALINEAMRLNVLLRQASVKAKIIVLCRTDLFERLTGPNKNKIRQDFAFEFDWYHDPRQPSQSALVRLANLRADLLYPNVDIFEQFFPVHIDNTTIHEFLLNHTRHTPRDYLQLLKHIQKYDSVGRLTREQILSGARDYSINYFMPEIRDELGGYLSSDVIESLVRLFSGLRRRDFYLSEIESLAKAKKLVDSAVNFIEVFDLLYDCSAVGQISVRPSGQNYYYFKYRTRHSSFNPAEKIIFHRGLWKALNLI